MKKVFISYSWDSDEHQEWVVSLVNKLRAVYGIDARCDLLLDKPNLFSMMVQQARINDKIVIVHCRFLLSLIFMIAGSSGIKSVKPMHVITL